MENHAQLTPMLRQYYDLKKDSDGAVLFFRMGDFYEIFGTDAEEIAPKLDVVLTSRERGDQTKIPFCGVPYHAATGYWLKLVRMGYKVSIVEQLESPAESKGLVKRGIVRTYTPGSLDELEGLDRDCPSYLMAHMELPGSASHVVAIADVSTGELRLGSVEPDQMMATIKHFRPKELLVRRFAAQGVRSLLDKELRDEVIRLETLPEAPLKDSGSQSSLFKEIFGRTSLLDQPCGDVVGGPGLLAALLTYIQSLQATTSQFLRVLPLRDSGTMVLSETVVRDLEIFETSRRRQSEGSFIRAIDRTLSPMGSRALRYALAHPFAQPAPILGRHEAVSRLISGGEKILVSLRDELKNSFDIARLSTRIVSGAASPHELTMIRRTLEQAARLAPFLSTLQTAGCALEGLSVSLTAASQALELITKALVEHPAALGQGRGVFKTGYDRTLDEKAELASSGEAKVEAYEALLRDETGISSLKIKEHKTFGLLIEVTKSNFSKVPSSFIRRQTMVNCERFSTVELKELNDSLATACDMAIGREAQLYRELLEKLAPFRSQIMQVAAAIGDLDLLQSFAWVAFKENWCRPVLNTATRRRLLVKSGRHPVVESMVGRHHFAANDVEMTSDKSHLLITGPNMAGKSTVMRQTALMVILCQAGSFVPALSAELPIFDRVFTRVGAADDLSRGQSTFMVEMTEAAEILRQATDKSLVILDEVGRGTSTTDGLALATAILEDLVDRVRCFSLFATHYHELVPMMASRSSIRAVQTEVIEKDNREIVFTHRLIDGASGSSFGIEVARLAGIPGPVLKRAREQLVDCEVRARSENHREPTHAKQPGVTRVQRDLFALENKHGGLDAEIREPNPSRESIDKIILRLEGVKIHRTTPIQAINILDELKRLLVPKSQRSLFEGGEHSAPS